jgi:hypothetical protein
MMTVTQALFGQAAEESSEVAIEASKCQRFGPCHEYQGQAYNPGLKLVQEFADLTALVTMLQEMGYLPIVPPEEFKEMVNAKMDKVTSFMAYSCQQGQVILGADDEKPPYAP